jgi:hypothetical protein
VRIWPLIIAGGLVLLGGGLWLSLRHQPSGSLLDDAPSPFLVEAGEPGRLITYKDPQVPLRALRWVGPLGNGLLAAQVLTQSDRQQVTFFRDGQALPTLQVPKPAVMGEGAWRVAVLSDVAVLPGGDAALLYTAPDTATADGVVVAVALASAEVKWTHRGAFQRMALAEGTDPGLYLYGGKAPILRLSLAAAKAAGPGRVLPAGVVKVLELPAEIAAVEALLPTGGSNFLASHDKGLSAFLGSKGWVHYPAPEDRGVACAGWRSTLVLAGRKRWWQAVPGRLTQIFPDGAPAADWLPEGFAEEDPFAPDARLLRLLGAEAGGALWFALAAPVAAPAPAVSAAVPAPPVEEAKGPEAATQPQGVDWAAYAAKGLDRIYRWDDAHKRLERCSWAEAQAALKVPAGVGQLGTGSILRPEAASLLVEGNRCAWWLPLGALPLRAVQPR